MRKISIVAMLLVGGAYVQAATIIGQDNFDGGNTYLKKDISPKAVNVEGMVWDAVSRESAKYDGFADTSLQDKVDQQGLLKSTKTDKVFGMYRGGIKEASTLTYTFDVKGMADLQLSMDWAAMGDLPAPGITVTASIDGAAPETIFEMGCDNNNPVYKMEDGRTVTAVRGAVPIVNGSKAGQILNDFSTVITKIPGTGKTLTVTFAMNSKGAKRVYAMDNLLLTATPVAP